MSKTIFIIDDALTMLMSISTMLNIEGYKVESANDGIIALKKLESGLKPDLIITDLNMPKMGGMELIPKIRALPGFRFTPILILTTESAVAKRDEAKKGGATGWLTKPVKSETLISAIKKVLPGA
jgi:two-component system, chemotaxis family, chemotaxis protein CheY